MNPGDSAQYYSAMYIGITALGCFGALFIWAYAKGFFKNIEAAKTRLLEIDKQTGVKK